MKLYKVWTYLEVAKSGGSKGPVNHMFLVIVLLCYNQETWQTDSSSVKDKIYVKISQTLRDLLLTTGF